jgi:membrane protein DedA with SNARE-associated domain
MADILEQVRMWIEQIITTFGYVGIGLMMFVENIFPPIPSEVIMPFAGSLAAKGELSIAGVFISGTVGALLGAGAIYYLGSRVSESRAREWFGHYGRYLLLREEDFDKAVETFNERGQMMVLIGRLLPTIRSLISLPAGLEKMNIPKFLFFTTLGTSLWNALLMGAGVWLGSNWEDILSIIDQYELVVWAILGLLAVIFVVRRVTASSPGQEAS